MEGRLAPPEAAWPRSLLGSCEGRQLWGSADPTHCDLEQGYPPAGTRQKRARLQRLSGMMRTHPAEPPWAASTSTTFSSPPP